MMVVASPWTALSLICVLAVFPLGQAEEVKNRTFLISDEHGIVKSPGFPVCPYDISRTTTWTFSSPSHLLFKFTDFSLPSCSSAKLLFSSESEKKTFCGAEMPPSHLSGQNVSLTFLVLRDNCGKGFVMTYISLKLQIDLPKHVSYGMSIQVQVTILNKPDEIFGECVRKIDWKKNPFKMKSQSFSLHEQFNKSGSVKYDVQCHLTLTKTRDHIGAMKSTIDIDVQDNLELLSGIRIEQTTPCSSRNTDFSIKVEHKFAYPIIYHLLLKDLLSVTATTSVNFTQNLNEPRPDVLQRPLILPWTTKLGPGSHAAILILENAVSVTKSTFSFKICEPLTVIRILPIQYIDLSPSNFTVTIQIPEGSPARIDIVLKNKRDNKNSASATTFCNNPQECREVSVQMSVSYERVFDIIATANNSLGKVTTTMGPVKSFPLVQDVFITSSFPINTTSPAMFFVFYKIPSNRGTYEIKLSEDGQTFSAEMVSSHVSFQSAERSLLNLRIPFNPVTYKVYNHSHLIAKPGKHEIDVKIMTVNQKQNRTAKMEIIALSASTKICLHGVKIQDGRKKSFLTETFSGTATFIFIANATVECAISDKESLEYKWKMYKAKSNGEAPDLTNEVLFLGVKTDTRELAIDPRRIVPGLYILEVVVSLLDQNGDVLLQVNDFVSIATPKFTMDSQICGASVREISSNVTELVFDASCSVNPGLEGIEYTWFCALMEKDLHHDKRLGRILSKGSCFEGKPSFAGENHKIKLNITNIGAGKKFFVRVFLSLPGYDDVFTDQQIVILSHPAPAVYLECWSNCENEVNPAYPLILHATCEFCVSLVWNFNKTHTGNFFKVEKKQLKALAGMVALTVEGFDEFGQKSSTVYERRIAQSPRIKVRVHPKQPIPKNSKAKLTFQFDEKVLLKISMTPKEGHPFTLIEYGYDQTVYVDVSTYGENSYSLVGIEACNLNGICDNGYVKVNFDENIAEVSEDTKILEKRLLNAIKITNSQEVVKQALKINTITELRDEIKSEVLKFGLELPLSSLESAKQSLDLIYYGSSTKLSETDMTKVVHKLSRIKSVINNVIDVSSFTSEMFVEVMIDLSTVLLQAMNTAKIDSNPSVQIITNYLSELSKNSLRETYEPRTLVYSSAVISSERKRFPRGSVMTREEQQFFLNASASSDPGIEFSDLMTFRFASSNTNFGTQTESPDKVVGVSFVGSRKIPGEAKPRSESFVPSGAVHFSFMRPRKKIKFDKIDLQPSSTTGLDQHSIPNSIPFSDELIPDLWVGKRLIAVQGDYGKIALKITFLLQNVESHMVGEIEYIELELEESSNLTASNFFSSKSIKPQDGQKEYYWDLPFLLEGDNIMNLSVKIKSPFPIDFIEVLPHGIRCSYWSDDLNDWTSKGCETAMGSSFFGWSNCSCDLKKGLSSRSALTRSSMKLFSSVLVFFPNKIDWSKLTAPLENGTVEDNVVLENIKKELRENPIMLITVILSSLIFGIALILAQLKDNEDKKRPQYIEVCDNMPDERYRYLVTIFTGSRRHAGPSSTVTIELIGDRGSIVHVLQKHKQERILLQGSVITFLATAPSCLGEVDMVRLWHGNEGESPEWYLERLVVRDYEKDDCWFFPVTTWLSDHHNGECQIDITVMAASADKLNNFYDLFILKCLSYLRESHIWYSSFAMRPWSVYDMTRTQRISCCMLIVSMFMATSLMFFKNDANSVDLGFYSFQWLDVVTGMETAALCFSPPWLISVIFRSSRDRHHVFEGKQSTFAESVDGSVNSDELSLNDELYPERKVTTSRRRKLSSFEKQMPPFHVNETESEYSADESSFVPRTPKKNYAELRRREAKAFEQQSPCTSRTYAAMDMESETEMSENQSGTDQSELGKHETHRSQLYVDESASSATLSPVDDETFVQCSSHENTSTSQMGISTEIETRMPRLWQDWIPLRQMKPTSNPSQQTPRLLSVTVRTSKTSITLENNSVVDRHQEMALMDPETRNFHEESNQRRLQRRSREVQWLSREIRDMSEQICTFLPLSKKYRKHKPEIDQFLQEAEESVKYHLSLIENGDNIERGRRNKNARHSHSKQKMFLLPSAGATGNTALIGNDHLAIQDGVTVVDVDPGSADLKPLPWYSIYFGWSIILVVDIICKVLTILYGMTYGVTASRKWALSLVIGIMQSIFLMEPLISVLYAYFTVFNNPRHDVTEWVPSLRTEALQHEHEDSLKVMEKLEGERNTNPCYKPPNVEKVMRDSRERMLKRVQRRKMKDMVIHLVYLSLLSLIAYGLRGDGVFHFKNTVGNMFKHNSKAWNNVKTQEDIYDWVKGPVIDALYGGYSDHFTDGQLIVISPPTLRQQRIKDYGPCLHGAVVPYFNKEHTTCKSGSESEEKGNFSAGWNTCSKNENSRFCQEDKRPWSYRAGVAWSLPYFGEHGTYDLSGYIAGLTRDKDNATNIVERLRNYNWIDGKTRIVMMETVLYNVALQYYCVVLMSFEIPNTGRLHSSLQLMVMKSHYVVTTFDYVIYLSLFALLSMVFYYLYNIANSVVETGIKHFRDVWNVLEFLTALTSVAAAVIYLSKAMHTDLALHARKNGEESLALFYVASILDYTLTCLLAYCIFFTTLRTVTLMEGHRHFQLSNATMQLIRIDLPGHLFCLLIGYFAFCHSGLIMFHDMHDFSSKMKATQSIVAYAAGAYMNNLLAEHPTHGGIFLLIFLLLYVKLFVNFYAFILEEAFRESKLILRNIRKEDFVTLRRKQIRSLFAIESRRKFEEHIREKEEQRQREELILEELVTFHKKLKEIEESLASSETNRDSFSEEFEV